MERLTQNNFDYCLEMCEPETQLDCAFYMSQTECVCGEAAIYNKLREYENAEQEGRLVMLPCKVGDTVYDIQDGHVLVLTVESIHIWSSGAIRISAHTDKTSMYWKSFELRPEGFGKVFFLTRADAEAALKGVSEDA